MRSNLGYLLKSFLLYNRKCDGGILKSQLFWSLILLHFFSRAQDVSIGCCKSKFPTILSLLRIENVNIINCLIDQKKVNKIIIMEHEWEARNLLKSVATSPRNLLYAITINKKGSGITQWYPAPNYR